MTLATLSPSEPWTEGHERVLQTVLFTDIVGATERAAALGDRRWREVLAQHHALVRRELARFGGREVDCARDGFMAAFDRPGQAVRCACAIRDAVRELGLEVRAGVHTGECESVGEKFWGIAVHIGARVAAMAGPGEVLVSRTVKDLVAGSEIRFESGVVRVLRGVPGQWRLFAVHPDGQSGTRFERWSEQSRTTTSAGQANLRPTRRVESAISYVQALAY